MLRRFRTLPLFLLFSILLSSCGYGRLVKKADSRYKIGEYAAAIPLYKRAASRIPSKEKKMRGTVNNRLADCYRLINDANHAEGAYRKAIRYKTDDSTVYLNYAEVLRKTKRYGEAASNYRRYLKKDSTNVWALNGLISCDSAKIWTKRPPRYSVHEMTAFNSRKGTTFCPVVADEEGSMVYFSSSRSPKGAKGIKNSKITGIRNNDLYVVKQKRGGKWEDPSPLSEDINTLDDEGACSLSPDGKTMFYTECRIRNGQSLGAAIFASKRTGGDWGEPKQIILLKDSSISVAHPALSPDGQYLYFVSDRPNGYGGKDIWRCKKKMGNEWDLPENLGPEINTPGDEMFPSFSPSGTFFFSSNGHPGLGGLDIFQATSNFSGDNMKWNVKNMGAPINSNGDDFGISFIGHTSNGYFSSNRNHPRGYDKIYYFGEPLVDFAVSGFVTDFKGQPLPDAVVRIVGDDGTNVKVHTKKDGSYNFKLDKGVNYVMQASCRAHLNQKGDFSTVGIYKTKHYTKDFKLPSMLEPVTIENIFFDFGRYTLRKESEEALNGLVHMLQDNPHITIEIASHTDMVDTEEFNQRLSERRAQAVVNYLIAAGIEDDRLTYKGYGETSPVKVTQAMAEKYRFFKEGDVLSEEFVSQLPKDKQEIANQINRRTEFTVTKMTYKMY